LLAHPLGAASYTLGKQKEDKAYEAYVFGLCLRAARVLLALLQELHSVWP